MTFSLLRLHTYSSKFGRSYDDLKQYIADIKIYVERGDEERKKDLDEQVKEINKLDDDEKAYMLDLHYKEYEMFEQMYLDTPIKSVLVIACSFLEYHLKFIKIYLDKYLIQKVKEDTIEIEKMKISDFKKSIYDMTGLDFQTLDKNWSRLGEYIKLRNIIAHNGLELSKPEHYKTVSSIPTFEINHSQFYLKNPNDILEIIDCFSDYVAGVIEILCKNLDKNNIK